MSRTRKLGVIAATLGAVASIGTILGWILDYGPRAEHDAFGWVDEWARASGSKPWVLWCGIAACFVALVVALFSTWDEPHADWFFIPGMYGVFLSTTIWFPSHHQIGWSAYGELAGAFALLTLIGGGCGLLLTDPQPRRRPRRPKAGQYDSDSPIR